jgi:hypothetical protein
MGMGIGGIATAIPRKIYGWVGAEACGLNSTKSKAVSWGGFKTTSFLRVTTIITAVVGGGGNTSEFWLYVVCGGSEYLVDYSAPSTTIGLFNPSVTMSGTQQITLNGVAVGNVFNVADVTGIRVAVSTGGTATAVIRVITLENLDP